MNTVARLEALATGPRPWLVTVHYRDGEKRQCRQPREAMAEAMAERERRKIGRELLSRETGLPVYVEAVTVEHKPESGK